MRKKRGYKRDTPIELQKDYTLFAIACEGSKTEPNYFNIFQYICGRVVVDIIQDKVSDEEMSPIYSTKSAPNWLLDRASKYIEKEGLHEEDCLWFVIDIDKWKTSQLHKLNEYCKMHKNWNIAISNPCFEVWLYLHKKVSMKNVQCNTSREIKTELSKLESGGYNLFKFIPLFENAIRNSKAGDNNPLHFLPDHKVTKVYQLAESLFRIIGKKEFDDFIKDKLPVIIRQESKRSKKK